MTRSDGRHSHAEDVMFATLTDTRLALDPDVRKALLQMRSRRRTPLLYMRWALTHPCNLLLLLGVLLVAFIGWSLPVLMVGLALEGLLIGLAPWAKGIRSRLDGHLDLLDRATTDQARDALVQQMEPRHQQEFCKMERLLERTRENLSRRAGGALGPGQMPDGSRLTASYIRLAIAHRAGQESLALTSFHELMETIRSLETVRMSSTDRMRELSERRLSVAYRRIACWCSTREGMDAIGQQLATIVELAQLMHEQSLAPDETPIEGAEIDRFIRELEESEGALRELASLSSEEVPQVRACPPTVRVAAPAPLEAALEEVMALEEACNDERLKKEGSVGVFMRARRQHVVQP
ncbi:hypothetical protein [Chondromyces crocatus]|uniref:Uncharacterized protein n=1 Tax=Chondromyces crocatus TaxID=52 RepID=A0A0K1EGT3_CHOCO|nr:hypothetical protein [Chondromyces crocatus]AKT39907.1 uncharacterized protein CMC5_040580 [Chondromyces crocatus]